MGTYALCIAEDLMDEEDMGEFGILYAFLLPPYSVRVWAMGKGGGGEPSARLHICSTRGLDLQALFSLLPCSARGREIRQPQPAQWRADGHQS